MTRSRRVEALERAVEADHVGDVPLYVSVETLDDLDALQLARSVKVYVGISPDDWDRDGFPLREGVA